MQMIELKELLKEKSRWVRRELLRIHKKAREVRVASSLSNIEILTALFYGGILKFKAADPFWPERDRFIVSKGHGLVSIYPILADLGFFPASELEGVGEEGCILGGIPDPVIPGIETINGSLGHGLGVALGSALALRQQKKDCEVYCMIGDGEMYEGSIWEALLFTSQYRLENLTIILDQNTKAMLDYTNKIMDFEPLQEKLESFHLEVHSVDGHDVIAVQELFSRLKGQRNGKSKFVIARTVKGKGVPMLESSPLCHIIGVPPAEIDRILKE